MADCGRLPHPPSNRRILKNLPLRETILIESIRRRAGGGRALVAGIGDDCAVLRCPPGHQLLVTTDFSLEGVHFRRDWHPPEVIGRRCLTRGLSDIAAMGGDPVAAFLSLAIPSDTSQRWVNQFLTGLLRLADEFHVPLAGGDTAQSLHGIQADIVVVGSVPKGKAILRSGARPGNAIYVTGELGGSAAAIAGLSVGKIRAADFPWHFHPIPRLAEGRVLRRRALASSMIDMSDGLSTDLLHICEESGVGAEIQADAIPCSAVGRPAKPVALDLALHGGEDYELLFTSSRRIPAALSGTTVTCIGRVTRGSGIVLVQPGGARQRLNAQGWEHFRKRTAESKR